jgi:phosphopantetheinyl transferase
MPAMATDTVIYIWWSRSGDPQLRDKKLQALLRNAALKWLLDTQTDRPLLFHRFLGKPELIPIEGDHEIEFNCSRTSGVASVAFGFKIIVGIDVERIDSRPISSEMLEIVLSEEELREYEQHDVNERLPYFYELWTRKEAVLKARGIGLQIPPSAVNVGSVDPTLWQQVILPDGTIWHVVSLPLIDGVYIAVACDSAVKFIEVQEVLAESLDAAAAETVFDTDR